MEGAPARTFVERRFIGTITDQIEALLIFEHSPNAAAEIVRVANRDASGLLREKVQALLRIERLFTTVGHLLAQIISAAAARRIVWVREIVGGGESEGLQSRRVHCVDHNRGASGFIDQAAQFFLRQIIARWIIEVIDFKAIRNQQNRFASRQLS